MNTSRSSSDFDPLLKAFRQIESRIELAGKASVLVATNSIETFKQQELAAHHIVTNRELLGECVPVRGRRRLEQSRLITARYPISNLTAVSNPVFKIVLSGQADMRIADYSVRCVPGDIIYIPSGLPMLDGSHTDYIEVTPQSTCDTLLLDPGLVQGIGLECSINHSRGEKRIPGNIDERCWLKDIQISHFYMALCAELRTQGNSKSTFYLLLLLLIQLQREISAGKAFVGWPFATTSPPKAKQKLVNQAMQYIDDHLDESLTIDVVARQMGVSRTILTRAFRKETGDTFKNYLIKHRLDLAKVLLKKANLPVNRVAEQVGLSSGRLRGLFRNKYNCTPDEFRSLKK
jgi:AraC-like DNA-binding protein